MKITIVVCLLLMLVPAALLANPNGQFDLTYQGSTFWRFFTHIALEDNHAFCTAKFGLMVFDISDSTAPSPISQLYLPEGYRRNIAVQGNYVYLSDGSSGFRIIDVANIHELKQVGIYDAGADVMGAAVVGNQAYLALWEQGLRILDITNPGTIVEQGLCDTARLAYDVAVRDSLAYVTTWNGGFQVISIANSPAPTLKGSSVIIDWLQGVVLGSDFAAVARGGNGLQLFNIADPSNPIAKGSWNSPGLAHDVVVEDTFAYVADDYYFQVVSVADQNNIRPLASLWLPFNNDLEVRNHCAYLVTQDSLAVIGISQALDLPVIGKYYSGYTPVGVTLKGNYAYVADEAMGLLAVDITDPKKPSRVGSVQTFSAQDVAILDGYAYVADDSQGLKVVDIASARSMYVVGVCNNIQGSVNQVVVSDTVVYLTTSANRLELVNVANKSTPQCITGMAITGECWGIAKSGHYAYVASDRGGLIIIDVANPQSPQLAGSYSHETAASGVMVVDTLAYVVTTGGALKIINVTRPQTPTLVGSFARTGVLRSVTVAGEYAYLGGETDSLWAIEISNPQAPTLAGAYKTPGLTRDVAVKENNVIVADYFGLLALDNGLLTGFPCGDWDGTNNLDIADAVYLVRYIFGGGPAPLDIKHGDVDCSGDVNIADAVYMVSYIFGGGKPPCYYCP